MNLTNEQIADQAMTNLRAQVEYGVTYRTVAIEAARLAREESARIAAEEERAMEQLIDERDEAQEALSQAYYLITGRSPEWSNLFGIKEALEEIDDAQQVLRATVRAGGNPHVD